MPITYKPTGICAKAIDIEMDGTIVKDVVFHGGCIGSHVGIVNLAKGMEIDQVIERLSGITCGHRDTSCPDQLACALKNYKNENR